MRDACLADRHLIGATLTEAALAELDDHVEPTLDVRGWTLAINWLKASLSRSRSVWW